MILSPLPCSKTPSLLAYFFNRFLTDFTIFPLLIKDNFQCMSQKNYVKMSIRSYCSAIQNLVVAFLVLTKSQSVILSCLILFLVVTSSMSRWPQCLKQENCITNSGSLNSLFFSPSTSCPHT